MTNDPQNCYREVMPEEPKNMPSKVPADADSPGQTQTAAPDPKELTPEEQMALYEEDLKETDWGHQPC